MKILTIVGARPQFIKAAMVSRAISTHNSQVSGCKIEEYILHTGQHFDTNMSGVFFDEMGIPKPTYQLDCGGGTHGEMTGKMLMKIEPVMIQSSPDMVLVYGDTNSTLAGALCAAKLHIPVVHVEAGLRSFNKSMPEEINRILTDQISTLLCCPTKQAVVNLRKESIIEGVYHVGDVMYDAAITFGGIAEASSSILSQLNIDSQSFYLVTMHRAENTDNYERIHNILRALAEIATEKCPVVMPLHPRTSQKIEQFGLDKILKDQLYIKVIPPVSFLDMIMLEKNARYILTDSGGIQKEAYFHKTPCITLRNETEWVETIDAGWNQIAGYKTENILQALTACPDKHEIADFGKGDAANKIVELLCR